MPKSLRHFALALVLMSSGSVFAMYGGGMTAGDWRGEYENWQAKLRLMEQALGQRLNGTVRITGSREGWLSRFANYRHREVTIQAEVELPGQTRQFSCRAVDHAWRPALKIDLKECAWIVGQKIEPFAPSSGESLIRIQNQM